MLIHGNKRYIESSFSNEEELEAVVIANAELIFGPSSIFFPKALIRTAEGTGTVPDGYAVDLASRRWFLVEAELSRHGVWSHIAPQIAKQLIAATNPTSRQLLVNLAVEKVKAEPCLLEKFEEQGIAEIDVRHILGEIFSSEPVVAMPIDSVRRDLREWAETVKADVKLWTIKKFVEFGDPTNIVFELPEEFRPTVDTGSTDDLDRTVARYDVTVADLIRHNLLTVGDVLEMSYKPRDGERDDYRAMVLEDGVLEVLGEEFSSPSYAALRCIQSTGSSRTTVNGWTSWRTSNGRLLSDLRDQALNKEMAE